MNLYHAELIKLTQSQSGQWQKLQYESAYQQAKQENQLIQQQILNPLCGDQVTWHAHINNETFALLAHETIGCILCQAASCLTHQLLINQSIDLIEKQFQDNNFDKDSASFTNEWSVFDPVLSVKTRLRCVSLPLLGLQELLALHSKK